MVIESCSADFLKEQFEILQKMCQGTRRKGKSVMILAACDPDGVMSAKIAVHIMQQMFIDYSMRPVRNNLDITTYVHQLARSADPPTIILCVNCGGNFPWMNYFEEKGVDQSVICVIIDSHRPFKLSNTRDREGRVHILDDDVNNQSADIPSDSESESDGEEESEDNPSQISRKRYRNDPGIRRAKKARIKQYYGGTYYGNPVAYTLYKACDRMKLYSGDLLWCAAVSLTSHLDLGFISKGVFNRLSTDMEAFIKNTNEAPGKKESSVDTLQEPEREMCGRDPIFFEKELNAPLYRHWTLWEALSHSHYLYGRLKLDGSKGAKILKELLAQCDLTPDVYNRLYFSMDFAARENLVEKLDTLISKAEFQIPDLTSIQFTRKYPSVPKNVEKNVPPSINYLTAIESGMMMEAQLANDIEHLVPETCRGSHKLTDEDRKQLPQWLHEGAKANFYLAYDSALFRSYTLLARAMADSIEIYRKIHHQCRQILDQKRNYVFSGFRYVKLDHLVDNIFRQPLMIRRLALWLINVRISACKKSRDRDEVYPQLVGVHDPTRKVYTFVGVMPSGGSEKNTFSERFRHAFKMSNCRGTAQSSFFDGGMCEVMDADYTNFFNVLKG